MMTKEVKRISRNISIIYRAERLIAQRRLSILVRKTGMMSFAGVVAGIGIVMLNISAYLALSEVVSAALSALIIGAVNLATAGIVAFAASKINADQDIKGVSDVRDMAIDDLEAEIADAGAEIRGYAQSVQRLRTDTLGAALPALLIPLVKSIIKSFRK